MANTPLLVSLLILGLLLASSGTAQINLAAAGNNILNPDTLFDALRRNITIQIPNSSTTVELPTPEQALSQSSTTLRGYSSDIKEETGVDLPKFIGWFAKMLTLFFRVIVDLLESVSRTLSPAN